MTADLPLRYAQLREKLTQLQAAPVKDMAAIDRIVDELQQLQLAIKGEHGIEGNNPNE